MYVPTLGPLGQDLTHIARYTVGAQALNSADRLAADGRAEQAAEMYRVARHVAEVLAEAIQPVSTRLSRQWLGTAHVIELRARNHQITL